MAAREHKIYTRTGDLGQTRLLSGESVGKDDLRVNTYGTLDELQSHLGMARALETDPEAASLLYAIQKDLFVAGAELASTPGNLSRLKRRISREDTAGLESKIDRLTGIFGLPKAFVIPGASQASAALHIARSVCRRVERSIVQLQKTSRNYQELIVYFNRLSDLLFVMAWASSVRGVVEDVLDGLNKSKSF